MRTTRADLDALCNIINHALLCDPGTPCTSLDPERAYAVEYAYGRPRLVRARGSVDVSPRLPAGQLADWCRAFLAGIDAERERPLWHAHEGGTVHNHYRYQVAEMAAPGARHEHRPQPGWED